MSWTMTSGVGNSTLVATSRDIDLSDEVIHIRRAAVRTRTEAGTFEVTTPKS